MSNMSYCRFQNTGSDFEDCIEAMEEAMWIGGMDLSEEEARAMDEMYEQAQRFIEKYRRLKEIDDEDGGD